MHCIRWRDNQHKSSRERVHPSGMNGDEEMSAPSKPSTNSRSRHTTPDSARKDNPTTADRPLDERDPETPREDRPSWTDFGNPHCPPSAPRWLTVHTTPHGDPRVLRQTDSCVIRIVTPGLAPPTPIPTGASARHRRPLPAGEPNSHTECA